MTITRLFINRFEKFKNLKLGKHRYYRFMEAQDRSTNRSIRNIVERIKNNGFLKISWPFMNGFCRISIAKFLRP